MEIHDFIYVIVAMTTQSGVTRPSAGYHVYYYEAETKYLLGSWQADGLTLKEGESKVEGNRASIIKTFQGHFKDK